MQVFAERFLGRVSEHAPGGRVPVNKLSPVIHEQDRIGRGHGDRLEPLLALAQGRLCPLPFGYVLDHSQGAYNSAGSIPFSSCRKQHIPHLAVLSYELIRYIFGYTVPEERRLNDLLRVFSRCLCKEISHLFADDFASLIAEGLQPVIIYFDQDTIPVYGMEQNRSFVIEAPVLRFALL